MPIGQESYSRQGNIDLECDSKAKVIIYFISSPNTVTDKYYQTTAKHMGVKVKFHNQEIKPGQKLTLDAISGVTFHSVSLYSKLLMLKMGVVCFNIL